jgi:hypothetical protein
MTRCWSDGRCSTAAPLGRAAAAAAAPRRRTWVGGAGGPAGMEEWLAPCSSAAHRAGRCRISPPPPGRCQPRPRQPACPAGGSSSGRSSTDEASVYKRMIILMRSLYSHVRVLPAYRMYRTCKVGPGPRKPARQARPARVGVLLGPCAGGRQANVRRHCLSAAGPRRAPAARLPHRQGRHQQGQQRLRSPAAALHIRAH